MGFERYQRAENKIFVGCKALSPAYIVGSIPNHPFHANLFTHAYLYGFGKIFQFHNDHELVWNVQYTKCVQAADFGLL